MNGKPIGKGTRKRILALVRKGHKYRVISKRFGVSIPSISLIANTGGRRRGKRGQALRRAQQNLDSGLRWKRTVNPYQVKSNAGHVVIFHHPARVKEFLSAHRVEIRDFKKYEEAEIFVP